jgi:hypothetical protein
MQQYRVNTSFIAVCPNQDSTSRFVTLEPGAIIRVTVDRTICSTGLVDVLYEGRTLAAFMRDIEDRAERVAAQIG